MELEYIGTKGTDLGVRRCVPPITNANAFDYNT